MKGLIFNLLEEFIVTHSGEEAFEEIAAACGAMASDPRCMVGPGSYPDRDFTTIVEEAARSMRCSPDELLYSFGRQALAALAARYPQFFARYNHPRDFLSSMGFIHNMEVKKLYDDSRPPSFNCEILPDGGLRVTYQSERGLCSLFSGLIDGAGDYYKTAIRQSHEACVKLGDEECVFLLAFAD